jgi:hypothetical protein
MDIQSEIPESRFAATMIWALVIRRAAGQRYLVFSKSNGRFLY